ncbi:MAG: S8 family peptidase, partial [Chthoniobacterales bacterium]
ELLIKFKAHTSATQRQAVLARRGAKVIRHFSTLEIDHVRVTQSRGARADTKAFAADDAIVYAQPNFIRHTTETAPPDDPKWLDGTLWGLEVIQAAAAWRDFTSGSGAIVVMDIDTGSNYNHPDLTANIWTNPGEIPGNGVDDDGNGYIDDIHGINPAYGNTDPMDDDPVHNHGTHTAGTIAAVGNNGIGVVGVSWNAKVIPCKAFTWQGEGEDADIVECFDYAIALKQSGVNIHATNNSYSGPRDPDPANFPFALKDAFDRAGAAGIVNVCSAGNQQTNVDAAPQDPCSFDSPSLICVAASGGAGDNVAGFTNYGPVSVDLAAPGDGILSTQFNDYGTLRGTSMSAPHVTGTVALLADELPDLSVETAKSLVVNNVTTFPQWAGLVASGGRLNLYDTLHSAVLGKTPFQVSSTTYLTSSSFQLGWASAPGMRYQVYATNNLTNGFAPLGSILTAAAGQTTMTYTDDSASSGPKFYQVHTVP